MVKWTNVEMCCKDCICARTNDIGINCDCGCHYVVDTYYDKVSTNIPLMEEFVE